MHASYVIKFSSGMCSCILGGCQILTAVGVVTVQICYLIIYLPSCNLKKAFLTVSLKTDLKEQSGNRCKRILILQSQIYTPFSSPVMLN